MLKVTAFARENKNVPGAFYRGKGFAAGHVDDLKNRGMFADTELALLLRDERPDENSVRPRQPHARRNFAGPQRCAPPRRSSWDVSLMPGWRSCVLTVAVEPRLIV